MCHQYIDDIFLSAFVSLYPELVPGNSNGLYMLKLNPDKGTIGDSSCGGGMTTPALDSLALTLKICSKPEFLLDPLDSSSDQDECLLPTTDWCISCVPLMKRRDLATVTHSQVTSRLENCNVLFVGLPLNTVWKLQLV